MSVLSELETPMKTGALYIRVSTDKQEELSPDAQIREGRAFAQKNHITIPDDYIFRDDGISGRKAQKRPAFQQLIGLAKSKEHPIDCIIVWKFSRFARNQEESIVYKSLLQKNKVEVLSVSEPLVDGPFGSLIERIIEWMDEYYSIRLSGEVVRGMTENAMRGKYQAAPPIGYKAAGGGLPPEKDPDTLPIVEYIVKSFLDGHMTPRAIAVNLNAMGYRTKRGNLYDARAVRYILSNPFYAGKNRWNFSGRDRALKSAEAVIYADGKWEPLYSMETYDLIKKQLDELDNIHLRNGRRLNDSGSYKHWLSGLIVCSACKRTLACTGGKKNRGMNCWAYQKGLCKESHYIGIASLESSIIEGMERLLTSDRIPYKIVHTAPAAPDKETELRHMLTHLNEREKRAKDAYFNEIDSLEEYRENRLQINTERARLEAELCALTSGDGAPPDDARMVANVREALCTIKDETSDFNEKARAMRSIVEKIVFDRKNTSFDFYLKLVK